MFLLMVMCDQIAAVILKHTSGKGFTHWSQTVVAVTPHDFRRAFPYFNIGSGEWFQNAQWEVGNINEHSAGNRTAMEWVENVSMLSNQCNYCYHNLKLILKNFCIFKDDSNECNICTPSNARANIAPCTWHAKYLFAAVESRRKAAVILLHFA